MAELITFANYDAAKHDLAGIYAIGETHQLSTPIQLKPRALWPAGFLYRRGAVIPEIAAAFDHELSPTPDIDNLGELIGKVGPAKELQENIGGVQDVLGTDEDGVSIARGWAERSGLLRPVERLYMTTDTPDDRPIDVAIISGGVRNWMARRAKRAGELAQQHGPMSVVLVGGSRLMKPTEGPDVEEGMTEADYLRAVVADQLREFGLMSTVVAVGSETGDAVMAAGATHARNMIGSDSRVAVVSNAGAWVQNIGQFRRAIRGTFGGPFDADGQQILAVSDSFPLGYGDEPTATHQNPFTAAGQIVRNAQELVRHVA